MAALIAGCSAEKLTMAELPKPVVKSFGLAYPDIQPEKWVKEKQAGKTIYAVAWKKDGKKSEAEFDERGNFIREQYR